MNTKIIASVLSAGLFVVAVVGSQTKKSEEREARAATVARDGEAKPASEPVGQDSHGSTGAGDTNKTPTGQEPVLDSAKIEITVENTQ